MASAPLPLKRRKNNWKNLPGELLDLILQKLVLLSDCIRFSVVCKDWLRIAIEHKRKQNRVNPMLFISNTDTNYRNLFNIWDNKVYNCKFAIPYRKNCNGCSHGWLAITEVDMSIKLINPFSSKMIRLPSIMNTNEMRYNFHSIIGYEPEYLIFKVILSCDLSLNPNNYAIAAIYDIDNKLALIKSGEQSWTYIDESLKTIRDCQFQKGRLYAINSRNEVIAIDDNSRAKISVEYVVINSLIHSSWTSYIVESLDGFLLLIHRIYLDIDEDVTVFFKVYRLNEQKRREWEEIDDVGNCALFLGNNQSICVAASSLPNCQPNSIYYTDDTRQRGNDDTGIFNLKRKEISRHYEVSNSLPNVPSAVWILPPWF